MQVTLTRRDALRLAAVGGGIVFASRLPARKALAGADDFFFVQLSDTHWGFEDPKANPDPRASLQEAVAAVAALSQAPDFVVFTGDLTHKTNDAALRRQRMAEFKEIIQPLAGLRTIFLPGEHDAAADRGAAFQEAFGATRQSFDHKGIHFITLDNVSDPKGVGEAQLSWLAGDLKPLDPTQPLVILTHKPLWDLKPDWDWFTGDGAQVIALLARFKAATVFYGHVHQEIHHVTGNVTHISARSALYPLPAPGAQPQKAPLPWNPGAADHGIGWRTVLATGSALATAEHPIV